MGGVRRHHGAERENTAGDVQHRRLTLMYAPTLESNNVKVYLFTLTNNNNDDDAVVIHECFVIPYGDLNNNFWPRWAPSTFFSAGLL